MTRLVRWLMVLGLATVCVHAQGVQVRVELDSGKVLQGEVRQVDDEYIVLVVAEGELRIPAGRVHSMAQVEDLPKTDPSARLSELASEPVPEVDPEAVPAAPGGETATVTPSPRAAPRPARDRSSESSDRESGSNPDHRISRWFDRYLWIVPQSHGHKASLGVVILLILLAVVQLSTRMANVENGTFGRGMAFAVALFVILAIELSVPTTDAGILAGMAVVDIALWFVLTKAIYRAGFYPASVMLISFTLASMVGILSLEVMSFVLQGNPLA